MRWSTPGNRIMCAGIHLAADAALPRPASVAPHDEMHHDPEREKMIATAGGSQLRCRDRIGNSNATMLA